MAMSAAKIVVSSLLAFAGPSRPGDEYFLGRDDADFARELGRFGYRDLAQIVHDALAKRPGSALEVESLGLELKTAEAESERDPKRRLDLLQEVVKAKEEFVASHRGSREAEATEVSLPDLYRVVGEGLAAAFRDEKDPDLAAKLRKAGDDLFTRAEEKLNKLVRDLDQKRSQESLNANPPGDEEPQQTEAERGYMLASYNILRTYYFHSLLLEQSDALRTTLLKRAIELFSEFQLDFADNLLCYEGFIYEGLCHSELGEDDAALASFDSAIRLREQFGAKQQGLWPMSHEAADIVSTAVLQKMTIQKKKNENTAAAAAAADFFATTSDGYSALKGLAILAAQAEAYQALGDSKGLDKAAHELIKRDPRGLGGAKGRELLGGGETGSGGSSLGAADELRLAQDTAGRGDTDRAIRLCEMALSEAVGAKDEADVGASACLLLGALYYKKGWIFEAAVAWDSGADRYQTGKDAPEDLWRGVNAFMEINKLDARSMWKNRVFDRMAVLASRYPNDLRAQNVRLIQPKQLEFEQKWLEAAKGFEAIPADSQAHGEALYRAGVDLLNHIRTLDRVRQAADIAALGKRAEDDLNKARAELDAGVNKTLDAAMQDRLKGLSFAALMAQANVDLVDGVGRANQVDGLLDIGEKAYPDDGEKLGQVRALRLRMLLATKKVDEAIAMVDSALAKDPSGKGLAVAAATLARELDQRASDLAKVPGKATEADLLLRKTIGYYVLGVTPQVRGEEKLRVDEVEAVANRLFVLGLRLNGVPDNVVSFTDWTGKARDKTAWEEAAKLYEAFLQFTPSYRTRIAAGRTYGFLARWKDAASMYAQVFEHEAFVEPKTKTIPADLMAAKPELLTALMELGISAREAGIATHDQTLLERSSGVFEAIVQSIAKDSAMWWQAKYVQIQLLLDRGIYDVAKIAYKSVERGFDDFDGGKFGYREKFKALKPEIDKH